MATPRVERSAAPVREEVVRVIRGAIIDGTFPPHGRLKERELCEFTGVSRTSVREAVRVLEAQGLVDNVPGEGPRVAVLSLDDARQLYELRSVLEGFGAAAFASNGSDEDKAELMATIAELREAAERQDHATATACVERFYDLLLVGGGNPLLRTLVEPLHARAGMLRQVSLTEPGRGEESGAELELVARAIASGDPEAAREASEHHVRNAEAAALRILERRGVALA